MRTRWLPLLLASGLALVACGDSDEPQAQVAIVEVTEDVGFYPACGNETLEHDGVRWFTVAPVGGEGGSPELQARLDSILAVDRATSPVGGRRDLARVVAPGPGDDVGTLVVWADGVAMWVSDSGDLEVWLVEDELTYDWVC